MELETQLGRQETLTRPMSFGTRNGRASGIQKACWIAVIEAWLWTLGLVASEPARTEGTFLGNSVPRLRLQISPEGVRTLRRYHQTFGQPRPEREDVAATLWEGTTCYSNVSVHLKGSFTFQPFEQKPSLTLHFDHKTGEQRFHGATKIHLNNSVQDPSYLCEQLGRELFRDAGVPCPQAGHAFVTLNGRDLGLYVVIEGANKPFLKKYFGSAKGNLYDSVSAADVSTPVLNNLRATSGENPEDRSDLSHLVGAARVTNPGPRWASLSKVLDVDRFISFAATEDFLVHWDGYCNACNNYRVFHDTERDRMVFIPHGLDQLFGRSSSVTFSITPVFRGLVAKALFSVPEARQRYLDRLRNLSTNEFRFEAVRHQVDRLANPIRAALVNNPDELAKWDQAFRSLKRRIAQRVSSVAQQLGEPPTPLKFGTNSVVTLQNWEFKGGPTESATGSRIAAKDHELGRITGSTDKSSGSWRTTLFLEAGYYELVGLGRTENAVADLPGNVTGLRLRISGDRSPTGMPVGDAWKRLSYEFEIQGNEAVELVAEYRGKGVGVFDLGTLQLRRKGP